MICIKLKHFIFFLIVFNCSYNSDNLTVLYPHEDTVLEYAQDLQNSATALSRDSMEDEKSIKEILGPYMNNNRFHEMHEQERHVIWAKR